MSDANMVLDLADRDTVVKKAYETQVIRFRLMEKSNLKPRYLINFMNTIDKFTIYAQFIWIALFVHFNKKSSKTKRRKTIININVGHLI